MGFSYTLTIDGVSFTTFSDVKIMRNVDGFGISGVSTSELEVSVPTEDYDNATISSCATVVFGSAGMAVVPNYYVSSRSKKGVSVTFRCYDRCMFTDQPLEITSSSFTNNKISHSAVLALIVEQCGFTDWASADTVPNLMLDINDVMGKTCRNILELISSAWCGFFKASGTVLTFIPFGTAYPAGSVASDNAAVSVGSVKGPITKVVMLNGSTTYTAGTSGADVLNTLRVQSSLASQALADAILDRVSNYTYTAWECEKCVMQSIGDIDAQITLADGTTVVPNSLTYCFAGTGVYLTCGRNDVTENEFDYDGALTRAINQRIKDGEKLGNNTLITRYQGIIHLGEEYEDEQGNTAQNRFGYSGATVNGVTEYGGAIIDRKTFSRATFNSDATSIDIDYGDKTYNLAIEYDDDGNITSLEQTEVED